MISRVEDIPANVLRPEKWDRWEVKAFTGKSGDIHLGTTFVRADNEEKAKELGKSGLRLIGVRGRFVVYASHHLPWYDSAMAGFVGFAS
jgi:hypothetical protein